MPRYIDAEKAIEAIDDLPNCPNGYSDTYDKACIIGTLEEVPTADVMPVVRCKNCKCWDRDEEYCVDFLTQDKNGFCSWWKRRDDAEIY